MPDCNHSTASCSCVPATALLGGEIRGGGFLCPGAGSCSGGDMLMVGFCYIQTLPPTSVPPTLSTHTAGGLGTAGDTGQ